MNFVVYDIGLLVLFVLFVSVFLYRHKKNLKREGLLFLYKTHWGIKLIERVGNKYRKLLDVLSYLVIGLGYVLMAGVLYLVGKIVWIYVFNPAIVQAVKVPPIMPLVPYLPQVFKLDFLPPFYFTYWIIIIAVIAITHEFAHGIFSARSKIQIKKTGFGFFPFFLPIFLAAFVEPDEEQMKKKPKKHQLAILGAGTFANIITAIIFFFVLWGFFSFAFAPAGITFDTYSYSMVDVGSISMINGMMISNLTYGNILNAINGTEKSEVEAGGEKYYLTTEFLEFQQNVDEYILLYDKAPAIENDLSGAIIEIGGESVTSIEGLSNELLEYSPGEKISIKTKEDEEVEESEIVLGEHPDQEGRAWLGIGFVNQKQGGIIGRIVSLIYNVKKPHIFYESRFDDALFIYNLLWWIILISFSVALINMLPVGIFDGGRFFYLTVLGLTKNEKIAKWSFKILTYLMLGLVLVLMVFWFLGIR